jgi:hypothetical protein
MNALIFPIAGPIFGFLATALLDKFGIRYGVIFFLF